MRLPVVASLALLCAVPASAVADSPQPASPTGGVAVDTPRPTFTWTHSRSGDDNQAAPIVGYVVVVVTDRIGVVASAPGEATSAVSAVDLPEERELRWVVRSIDAQGRIEESRGRQRASFVITTVPAAPTITGGPAALTSQRAATVSWTGTRSSTVWRVAGLGGAIVAAGESPSTSGQAAFGPLADGAYTVSVAQRNLAGAEGPSASRAFRVDATPPAPPTFTATAPASATQTTSRFAWTGVEPEARVTWHLTTSRGTSVAGPSDSTSGGAAVGPLAPGSYLFHLRQTDLAGNVAAWRTHAFTIATPPPVIVGRPAPPGVPEVTNPNPAPASPPVAVAAPVAITPGQVPLPSRRPDVLRPRMGAVTASARPVLRWKRQRNAVRYNVQIFATSADGGLRKVRSVFPRSAHYRLPARRSLTAGSCYVWRVWPFFGKSFARTPLGVSHFCVAGRPPG